jgi:Fe-S cluster assembly protein SufD
MSDCCLSKTLWFGQQASAALQSYEQAPLPSRLDERWRFASVKRPDLAPFLQQASGDASSSLDVTPLMADSLVIRLTESGLTISSELPEGLEVLSLVEWVAQYPAEAEQQLDYVQKHQGAGALLAAHRAYLKHGVVLRVAARTAIEQPVELITVVSGASGTSFPLTVVQLAEGSSLDLLERHVSTTEAPVFAVGYQSFNLATQSTLHYGLLQKLNASALCTEIASIQVAAGARCEHLSSMAGAKWTRQELTCSLDGREASAELLGANFLTGERELDQRTYQHHVSPGAASNLLYKTVLKDKATNIFSGMIRVEQGAHETDAYQSNRNLMMSEQAESHSLPGLEILADGVKCSHGTASAPVNSEELFYLLSRGIPQKTAELMIAEGFLRQVATRFTSAPIAEALLTASLA